MKYIGPLFQGLYSSNCCKGFQDLVDYSQSYRDVLLHGMHDLLGAFYPTRISCFMARRLVPLPLLPWVLSLKWINSNVVGTVDGSEIPNNRLGCIKPCK